MAGMLEAKRRFCGVFAVCVVVSVLTACGIRPSSPPPASLSCDLETTPISAVQGQGQRSPMVGQVATVTGIVTFRLADGFVVQQAFADTDPDTSDALLVAAPALNESLQSGDELIIRGKVAELGVSEGATVGTMTALSDVEGWGRCARGQRAPLTAENWPLENSRLESLEGMQLVLDQTLYASDVYRLATGRFSVSDEMQLFTATENLPPGDKAGRHDAANRRNQLALDWPGSAPVAIRSGDPVVAPKGVLLQLDGNYHLQLSEAPALQNLPVDGPRAREEALRVVSFNLLNYFNGDGQGGGFPTERGAETAAGFAAQRQRHRALFAQLKPDVLAVQELENDGFGPGSAAADLLADLQQALPGSQWTMVQPEDSGPGQDTIRVGIAYRSDVLHPVGPALTLAGPSFAGLSRVPLAQGFESGPGLRFTVVVNHLKSKGGCPEEGEVSRSPGLQADAWSGDGQACWNAARTAAAEDLLEWVDDLRSRQNLPVLMVGDFNAYRQEDPIRTLRDGGLIELVEQHGPGPHWTFIYRGARGSLDYAFGSADLLDQVDQAFIWHANAADAPDMNLEPIWRRASDHDPVVVDLKRR